MSEKTENKDQGNDGSSSLAGFAGLSEADFIDVASEGTGEKIETPKEKVEEIKIPSTEDADKLANPESKEEKKPVEEEAAKDKKPEEEEGFKTPGETLDKGEEEVEAKWIDIAKEVGFEIKDDSYESFVEGQKSFIENIKTQTAGEVKVKALREEIAELPAESQLLILGLKSGLTKEQIDEPFRMVREFKELSDADLVAKDLELKGFDEDVIANEIEKFTENDKLAVEAKKLRTILDQSEKSLTENKLAEIKELEESSQKIFKEKLAKESEEIAKHINKIDKFLDSPVSKKNKEYLINKWNSGAYHELAKDPEKIIKFMLWDEFGEQGVTNMKNNLTSKLVEEKVRKGHNIPPIITTGSSASSNENAKNPLGNFEAFNHLQET